MVAITFDDGPSPEWTPGRARRAARRRARGRRSSRSAARCALTPTSPAGSWPRATSSRATARTTRCSCSPGPRAIVHQFRAAEGALADRSRRQGVASSSARPTASETRSSRPWPGSRATGWSAGPGRSSTPPARASTRSSPAAQNVLRPGRSCSCTTATAPARAATASQTVEALPRILETVRERGLEPVTVSQLAEELQPHRRTALKAAAFGVVVAALVLLVSQRFSLQVVAERLHRRRPGATCSRRSSRTWCRSRAKALTWKAAFDAVPGDDEGRPLDVAACATSCRRSSSASS